MLSLNKARCYHIGNYLSHTLHGYFLSSLFCSPHHVMSAFGSVLLSAFVFLQHMIIRLPFHLFADLYDFTLLLPALGPIFLTT